MKTIINFIRFLVKPFTDNPVFLIFLYDMFIVYKINDKEMYGMWIAIADFFLIMLLIGYVKNNKLQLLLKSFIGILTFVVFCVENVMNAQFNMHYCNQAFQIVQETNFAETKSFLTAFILQANVINVILKYTLSLLLVIFAVKITPLLQFNKYVSCKAIKKIIESLCFIGLFLSLFAVYKSKLVLRVVDTYYLMNCSGGVEVEKHEVEFTNKYMVNMNSPFHRIIKGLKIQTLLSAQYTNFVSTSHKMGEFTCDNISDNVIFIIGESYVKRHAQIYGYNLNTTPTLDEELQTGNLSVFTNVITASNYTSDVFKNMLSMHSLDQEGDWSDVPTFLQYVKQSNYFVSFLSNQFVFSSSDVFNSTGGFFLNGNFANENMFDYRNEKSYEFDHELLRDLECIHSLEHKKNFIIFHGWGQHVGYKDRCPDDQRHFSEHDYKNRESLSNDEKTIVAYYDDAVMYQDSIYNEIFKMYKNDDVIIVFVSDHGENVYDFDHRMGRTNNVFTPNVLRCEYEVPMWIWCSEKYKEKHPSVVTQIEKATDKPFMTDDISHLFCDLVGLRCKWYDSRRSLINKNYNIKRKRLLGEKRDTDYDLLIK